MDVQDKVCVITGSGGGLGKEFAGRLLAMGSKVVICDINESLGRETAKELREIYGGGKIIFVHCDVTKADQVKEVFDKTEAEFGDVDILVNNAGVMGEKEGWKLCLDINLYGLLFGCNEMFDRVKNKGNQSPQNVAFKVHFCRFRGQRSKRVHDRQRVVHFGVVLRAST